MKKEMIKGMAIGMLAGAGIGMLVKPGKSKTHAMSKTARYIGNAIDTIGDVFGL